MAKIYLSFNNQEESFELPVLPEKVEISEQSDNKNHVLQNIGEVTLINAIKQPTLKIESFFPVNYGPYVNSRILKQPIEYIEMLKRWRDTKRPMRLVIVDIAFPISWPCTIESLTYREEGGSVGDIYYEIEFKEYRWFKVKKVQVVESQEEGESTKTNIEINRPTEKEVPNSYTVKAGDTLYAICKKHLGDGNKFNEVAAKNGISNPNKISVGQVIKF